MTALEKIAHLNETRYGLDFDGEQAFLKLEEELREFADANATRNHVEQVDALADIIVIAAGELRKLGYDPERALNETIMHIMSRRQDPEQKRCWDNGTKAKGEKWKKDMKQKPKEIYQCDYSYAKIKYRE